MDEQQSPPPQAAKANPLARLSPVLLSLAGLCFMGVALFQSRDGESPAVFISLGAVFIALSAAASARARKASITKDGGDAR
jgi:hypothetical protein